MLRDDELDSLARAVAALDGEDANLQVLAQRCLDEADRETRLRLITGETLGKPVLHAIPDPMKRGAEIFAERTRTPDADLPAVGSFHG